MNKNIYKIYMRSKKYNKSGRYSKKSKLSKIRRRKIKNKKIIRKTNKKTKRKRGGAVQVGPTGQTDIAVNRRTGIKATGQTGVTSNGPTDMKPTGQIGVEATGQTGVEATVPPQVKPKTAAQQANQNLIGTVNDPKKQLVTESKFLKENKKKQEEIKLKIKGIKDKILKLNNDELNKYSTENKKLVKKDIIKSLETKDENKLGSGGFGGVYTVLTQEGGKNNNLALKLFTPNNFSINSVSRTASLTGKKEMSCLEYINNITEIVENKTREKNLGPYLDILKHEVSRMRILKREIDTLLTLRMFPKDDTEREECKNNRNIVLFEGLPFNKAGILQGYFMEICDGSLENCVLNDRCQLVKKGSKEVLFSFNAFLKQVLKGLNYMHGNNLAHLDLFPRNILHKRYISSDSSMSKLKLCDFGFTGRIDSSVRDLFPEGEFVTIPNNHHIDFYKKDATIKKEYDYYTLGISIYQNFFNGTKIEPTITSATSKLINIESSYTQLIKLPDDSEISGDMDNFYSRKAIIVDILNTENYIESKYKNFIPDETSERKVGKQELKYKYIPEILVDIINGKEVEYNESRLNYF